MSKRDSFTFRALLEDLRRMENGELEGARKERGPLAKSFRNGVYTGIGIAADTVEDFMFRQMNETRKREALK